MSYDLNVYIKYEGKPDLEEQIIAFFRKYGLDIELHPEFDLLKSAGFMPMAILKTSEFFKNIDKVPEHNIIAGSELFIVDLKKESLNDYAAEKKFSYFLKNIFSSKKKVKTSYNSADLLIITSSHSNYMGGVVSSFFSAAIVSIFDGVVEDIQTGQLYRKNSINALVKEFPIADQEREIDFENNNRFNGWFRIESLPGGVILDIMNVAEGTACDYKFLHVNTPLARIYPNSRTQTLFRHLPASIQKIFCIKTIFEDGKTEGHFEAILIGERENFPQDKNVSDHLFCVELPIKSVEQTEEYCIIYASAIHKEKKIGFKIEIPNQFAPIFADVFNNTLNYGAKQVDGIIEIDDDIFNLKCRFLSTGKETVNFFNALGIGNFKKIKSVVEFDFKPLVGYVKSISPKSVTHSNKTIFSYDETVDYIKEGDSDKDLVKIKLSVEYPDRVYICDEEEHIEILQLLIDIIPSKEIIRFMEKNTGDRHNFKHTFIDYE